MQRFVVIDDAGFIRELLKNTLTELGYDFVGEASDGAEAMQVVSRSLPDIIFLDMVLPGENGVAIAKNILEIQPDAKIIACTTLEKNIVEGALDNLGITRYLQKPFSKESLEKVLRDI